MKRKQLRKEQIGILKKHELSATATLNVHNDHSRKTLVAAGDGQERRRQATDTRWLSHHTPLLFGALTTVQRLQDWGKVPYKHVCLERGFAAESLLP